MTSTFSSSRNDLNLVWSKDRYTIQELINNEYGTFSESKSLLVKIHCLKKGCRCVLKNEQALTLKCVSQVTLVRGIWSKNGTKLSNQGSNKVVNVIITSSNITWFEILNESGQTAPSWTSTKMIIKNKPSSFLVRRELKCLLPRKTSSDTFQLCVSNASSISAGTVLNFVQFKEFFVQKGKKSKEVHLIQCCDNNLSNVFIYPDEKCLISPLAGLNSITGVHNLYSIIQQFQLPLSIRPALSNLADWLPSSTDKSCLRLCESYCGELVFLEPLSNPSGERFFVITPEMMEAHQISIANTEGSACSAYQQKLLEQHSSRVEQFLLSSHPFEGLRYLLRHLIETTNQQASATAIATGIIGGDLSPTGGGKSGSCAALLGGGNGVGDSGKSLSNLDSAQKSRLDKLFDEIEDIYYYVRTGRFPSHSRSTTSLPCTDRHRLLLHHQQHHQLQPQLHQQPANILTPINSPDVEHAPNKSVPDPNNVCNKCRINNNNTHILQRAIMCKDEAATNTLIQCQPDDNQSGFTTTSSHNNRSISWNDLHENENKPPIPPLPLRIYFNVQNTTSPTVTTTGGECSSIDQTSPALPHRCRPKRSQQQLSQLQHHRSSFPVVNNPSYDQSFHTLIPRLKPNLKN